MVTYIIVFALVYAAVWAALTVLFLGVRGLVLLIMSIFRNKQ